MDIGEAIFVCDPVKIAVMIFHGNDDNRRLWGWYCREMGRERFREILYQKWRENEIDGMPRNPPAAFQATLCAALPKKKRP